MHSMKLNRVITLVLLLAVVWLTSAPSARAGDGNRGPDLPFPLCGSIQVPEGNKVSFHVYARGVQLYRWNGATWDFVAPVAKLFAEEKFFGEVGDHYRGPVWESKSGSKVEARRVPNTGCTPDPTAIPWLLLSKYETNGPGIFSSVTYIQRVNTTGGVIPSSPGLVEGEVKEVPYTAEYYFYRAQD
jgi:hypothetical protein